MKRVLSIQDLSCLGKCSITVALPVLSAMGCACSVLPTAVLSPVPVYDRGYSAYGTALEDRGCGF